MSKKEKKDIVGMPSISKRDGKPMVTPAEKIKVWKEYE